GSGDGRAEPGRLPFRPRRAAGPRPEAAAGDVLQGEERAAVVLADLVDLDDVRVLQPGHGFGLGAEPAPGLQVGVGAGEDYLEGNPPVEGTLAGLVDDAHAPPAQPGDPLP